MAVINKIYNEYKNWIYSKSRILHYPDLIIKKGEVNLHWYHSELESKNDYAKNNLGDILSPYIVNWFLSYCGFNNSNLHMTKNLYAIGSILLMGSQDATVWGSGLPYSPNKIKRFFHNNHRRTLDIRCVRGPKTMRILREMGHNCPPMFGDPAVLLPLIYKPNNIKKFKCSFIPHYSKIAISNPFLNNINIIDMRTDNVEFIINQICASEKVVSSSLHGLIIAESYGVPAIFLQDREDSLNLKYEDWYESTCRKIFPIAHSFEEAMNINFELPSNIKDLQRTLLDTFPIDLYKRECLPEEKTKLFNLLNAK